MTGPWRVAITRRCAGRWAMLTSILSWTAARRACTFPMRPWWPQGRLPWSACRIGLISRRKRGRFCRICNFWACVFISARLDDWAVKAAPPSRFHLRHCPRASRRLTRALTLTGPAALFEEIVSRLPDSMTLTSMTLTLDGIDPKFQLQGAYYVKD